MKVFQFKFETPMQRHTQPKKGTAIILAVDSVDARCHLRYHLAGAKPVLNRNQPLLTRIVREATYATEATRISRWTQGWKYDTTSSQLIYLSME